MAYPTRRVVILASLVAFVLLMGRSAGVSTPVHAAADTVFETANPPKLYAGDFSHPGDAYAGPVSTALPQNGYCVHTTPPGQVAASGFNLGFASVPAGQVISTDFYDNGTASTADDTYCVVVRAQATAGRLLISWNYVEGGKPFAVEILGPDGLPGIPVITIALRGVDGVVGGAAIACTVGWDPSFLTGRTSNLAGTLPDPLDDVRATDFSTVPPLVPGVVGDPYRDPTATTEWCINIASDTPQADVDVIFAFDAVYRRTAPPGNLDDQSHTVALPAGKHIAIVDTPYSELRHVSPAGQLQPQQISAPLVIYSRTYVCVIPSDATDILLPGGVLITNLGGDQANVSGLQIFNDGITPGFPDFGGVRNGTICISWISTSPGEQTVRVTFTKVDLPFPPEVRVAGWTSDHDPIPPKIGKGVYSPLIVQWNRIDSTRITTATNPDTDNVTFGSVTVPIEFDLGSGRYFISGSLTLTEWVFGSHVGPLGRQSGLLDGAVVRATIPGTCGHFIVGNPAPPAGPSTVYGTTIGGRFELDNSFETPPGDRDIDDLQVSITGDPGCTPNSVVRVIVDVFYPNGAMPPTGQPVLASEYVDIHFEFRPFQAAPIVAWAGQTVKVVYAIASTTCPDQNAVIDFVRGEKQPGAFTLSGGMQLDGAGHVHTVLGTDCGATAEYESEDPGEVDITVTLSTNPYSKVVFTVYFLAIEDVTLSASAETVVSARGDLSATVRGWFTGNNPSGNPARVTPDGRSLPANRWVLPDDWGKLIGISDARQGWPSSPDMPAIGVTFQMANESVVNNYATKQAGGDAGWLLPDSLSDFSANVNPHSFQPSALGKPDRPRILSDITDLSGTASVDTFGDFNLSFEGCKPNATTGNPHCEVNDLVGRSKYVAVAWYGPLPGKWPPASSNVVETLWRWDGFKRVTVIPGGTPTTRYVIVHLRDRDGFCNAIGFNNVLGAQVNFQLYGTGGRIIATGGSFSVVNASGTEAVVTTFDTADDFDVPTHRDIALDLQAEDECQAWIRISDSLNTPVSVRVSIPAPPPQLPGTLRIVGVVCTSPESVTIRNVGNTPVPLAGFALRSDPGNPLTPEEHFQLDGLLLPGEGTIIPGGVSPGWLNASTEIFRDPPAADYVRLVWNEVELNRANCDGTVTFPPYPTSLPPDPEGEIVIDAPLVFGAQITLELREGWNLITAAADVPITEALKGAEDNIEAIYTWDARESTWARYISGAPSAINTIPGLNGGQAYWVQVKRPFTLTLPG